MNLDAYLIHGIDILCDYGSKLRAKIVIVRKKLKDFSVIWAEAKTS